LGQRVPSFRDGSAPFGQIIVWTGWVLREQVATREVQKAGNSMTERRSGSGDRPKRRENLRFLIGHGAYLDDLDFDDVTHQPYCVRRTPMRESARSTQPRH
jgi:hypothetical protein